MKKYLFLAVIFSFFTSVIYAQNSDVKVGDVYVIGKALNNNYKHIHFPKTNFIIKKGGVASYKNIKGEKVTVTSIDKKKDGSVIATIKLTSNASFFNSHKYVTVAIDEAIRQKELLTN
ncbi:dihydroorotase [Kordia sp.]|uniref:dihydroorotase n=1 Tax=Kordia sp. TaxID=1965332 RepID=UPI003D6C004B